MADDRPEHEPAAEPECGHEERIRQFEHDWLAGLTPALDEYLTGYGTLSDELLVELVQIDLEFRIKAGQSIRAGNYLDRYPHLAADPDIAADLIASEFDLRRRRDPSLTLETV